MAGQSDGEVLREMVLAQREMVEVLRDVSGKLTAYQSAVHSLIETHPDKKALATDFLERMDRVTEVQGEGARLSPVWQLILNEMTFGIESSGD